MVFDGSGQYQGRINDPYIAPMVLAAKDYIEKTFYGPQTQRPDSMWAEVFAGTPNEDLKNYNLT